MKQSRAFKGAAAAIGMLLLILDSKTALTGAAEGVDLCLRTVIPSLLPFFFLSVVLTGALLGISIPILRPLGRLMGIPQGAESILAAGFLGGYPVGAQAIGAALSRGQLTEQEARRMMAFCSNAGPAFLFGIGAALFPCRWMPWALWGIHILSAIMVSLLIPGKSKGCITPKMEKLPTLTAAMASVLEIMARVCGWVILFRVVIAFLDRWFGWFLPDVGKVILSGLLELSNGCCDLAVIKNVGLRFILCSAFLAFGGLCVLLQTYSVAAEVDMGYYFPGKVMQMGISLSLSSLIQLLLPSDMEFPMPFFLPLGLLVIVIFLIILLNNRKISRNYALVGV